MSYDYDLFVIGAGPGGVAAAERAAKYGARVAIAERDQVGGTCVVHGCIPEKLMTYAASFSKFFRNADEYGWGKVQSNFDWQQFMAARNNDINHLTQVHTEHLQEAGAKLLTGNARLIDAHTIDLGDSFACSFGERQYTAEKILLAVGGKAIKPDIPGIEYAITSRELLTLDRQPDHLAIVGSNHIAVKLAGIMNGLISKVTLVVAEDNILPGKDEEVRKMIQAEISDLGVRICTNSKVEKITKAGKCLNVTLSCDDQPIEIESIVFIQNRIPNLEGLDLEKAGVEVKAGAIAVDEYSRTTQPNIFAVGDCTPRPHWTPVAIASGRAFADTEFGNKNHIINYDDIPYVVSAIPEAAVVGLTEAQAREKFGESVRCYTKKFQPLFNLMAESKEKTLLKLIVESDSERIVGAHMLGNYAAEIIQMIALAMKAGVTKRNFDSTIGIHPTVAEEFFTMH
jgi:glutathione reductase (NADPH)